MRGALAVLDFDAAANEGASFIAPLPQCSQAGKTSLLTLRTKMLLNFAQSSHTYS